MPDEKNDCLLDAWMPPEGCGEPLGCVATTFTFSAAFFEEHCLGRLLGIQSDPTTEAPAYVVEREERLAQLSCAAVIVDQHFAKGARNLRWDLLSSRPGRGIQHAKVSLLAWTKAIRVIIASANLTPDGYRRNHEIFTVFDFNEESEAPRECLRETIDFLQSVIADTCASTPASARASEFLKNLRPKLAAWSSPQSSKTRDQPRATMVFSGPGRSSVPKQLGQSWPAGSPPENACVLSPFFDPDETQQPAIELWALMRQRGGTSNMEYAVIAEEDSKGTFLIHAPGSLATAGPNDRCVTTFTQLKLEEGRPLHAKSIQLSNGTSILQCIGSSNFTSAGLGLGSTKNIEANVAFVLTPASTGVAYRRLEAIWPETESIPESKKLRFEAMDAAMEDEPALDQVPLPAFFVAANFQKQPDGSSAVEIVTAQNPPAQWSLALEDGSIVATDHDWERASRPATWLIAWTRSLPPSGFNVAWGDKGAVAWLPVNLRSAGDIPPPEALRDLPLEVLLELLTSARPLYQVLGNWLTRQPGTSYGPVPVELDPHRRVDTSEFLLQRTRRVSRALAGLRARLERPMSSLAGLAWIVEGPVGVVALWRAINAETKHNEEKAFLLAELAMELGRVQPSTARGCLSANEVRQELLRVIGGLETEVKPLLGGLNKGMASYAKVAFTEAQR